MQHSSSHSYTAGARKLRARSNASIDELDATEGCDLRNPHTKLLQRVNPVGHQALTARFADRRLRLLYQRHRKALLADRNRGREPGWAAANNEDVGLHHLNKTNSEQNPGPIAASRLSVPAGGRRFIIASSRTKSTEADERLP